MQQTESSKWISAMFITGGLVFTALTAGFFTQSGWATALWPWPVGRLSYIFIASITAAIAAPMIWIGFTGEFDAAQGGAVNLGIAAAGSAAYLFTRYGQDGSRFLLISGTASAFFLLVNVGIFLWSRHYPIQDQRELPLLVQVSFGTFSVLLILVGALLVLQSPVVFPWPLRPESSVIFGWIFWGAASYFAFGLRSPRWHHGKGQLLGFLAYDLVLIIPYLANRPTSPPIESDHLCGRSPLQRIASCLFSVCPSTNTSMADPAEGQQRRP